MAYDFRTIRYIPGLDGIRFFAVSIVMIAHFGFGNRVPGGLGVTIFFFLSGFLITTLLMHETRRAGKISVGNFYIRRFLRLAPEMIALLLFSSMLAWALGISPAWADIVAALTYTTNYYTIYLQAISPAGVAELWWGQLWSLAVEEHYYLTFPLIFPLIFGRSRRLAVFFIIALVGCLAWRCFVLTSGISGENWHLAYSYLASETRFDSIVYGALFAFIAQEKRRLSQPASGLALAAGVVLLLASLLVRDEFFRESLRYSLQGIGILLIFSHLYLSEKPSPLITTAEFPLLRWGGVLSYGAYLWHLEFVRFFSRVYEISAPELPFAKRLLFVAAGFVSTFLVAWVSYRCIAAPVLKLRRSFGSHTTTIYVEPNVATPETAKATYLPLEKA